MANFDKSKILTERVGPITLVTKSELAKLLGVSTRTIYRWWNSGYLPEPSKTVSGRCVGWVSTQIERWLKDSFQIEVTRQ